MSVGKVFLASANQPPSYQDAQDYRAFQNAWSLLLKQDDCDSEVEYVREVSAEVVSIESTISAITSTTYQSDADLDNAIEEAIAEESLMISNTNLIVKVLEHVQNSKNPSKNKTIELITNMLTTATQSEIKAHAKISMLMSERNRRESDTQMKQNEEAQKAETKRLDEQQKEIERLERLNK